MEFKCDLGIICRPPNLGRLKVIPYTKEEFCLVTSPEHKFAESSPPDQAFLQLLTKEYM